ncbi:MAG: outer membrane protein assembly factor BamB family protein [Candidatus Hodarchaeales archaeon]|jgi:outer membrane protein assembly factor BamB
MKGKIIAVLVMMLLVVTTIPAIGNMNIGKINFETQNDSFSMDDSNPVSRQDWWPMFRHDLQHSGYSTFNAPDTNNVLWSYTTGDNVRSSPAVADGKVYIGSWDGNVYCLDANTGGYIWNYTIGVYAFSSPSVADGKVYIGSYDGNVYCLDANIGGYIWSYTTGDYVGSSPAVVDGKVYIGSDDDNVYCLDANTGGYIWNYTTGDGVFSSPAVADGKVYIGSKDDNVYCLDANTGGYIWNYTTGDMVWSSPAVADGKVYIGSWDDNVYCLDANTGGYIWSYTTGSGVRSSPAVADGKVFVGSVDNYIYCFEDPNYPPFAPIITGPSQGNPNTAYKYTFHSSDPDGDDVRYHIDWDDETPIQTTGYSPSGTQVDVIHIYTQSGKYTITAYAEDENGNTGPCSTFTFTCPRDKAINNMLLQNLLERFPLLQKLLLLIK